MNDRLRAFGNQLIEIHIWLREEIEQLREGVDSYFDGAGPRPRELKAHCLAFCSALDRHHTGEDNGAFHVLARDFPELAPVLAELDRDHRLVAWYLRKVEHLVGGLDTDMSAEQAQKMRSELGDLAALMETHFVYEEKKIVAALNSLDPDSATTEDLLGVSPPS